MDLNLELSKLVGSVVMRFDSLPRASGSTMADAASRDLQEKSSNIALFQVLGLVAGAVIMYESKALSLWLSHSLARHDIDIQPGKFLVGIFVLMFIGSWVFVITHWRRQKKANLAATSAPHLSLIHATQSLIEACRPAHGMLAENLFDLVQRMAKTFPLSNAVLKMELLQLVEAAFAQAGFAALGNASPRLRTAMDQLNAALAVAWLETMPVGRQRTATLQKLI